MRTSNRSRVRSVLPWLGLLLLIAAVSVVIWFGPVGRGASWLELLVYDGTGRAGERVSLGFLSNDPLGPGTPRVPLVLALRNTGPSPLRARSVSLSLPAWLRLERDDGTPFPGETEGGNPLRLYRFEFDPVRLEPDRPATVMPGGRGLWVRPFVSPWRCSLQDGLPTFWPAPALAPELLADATVFWTVEEAGAARRATGTFVLALDPNRFAVQPAPALPDYPPRPIPGDVALPDLTALDQAERRIVECGTMVEPLSLELAIYTSGSQGRVFAVGVPDGAKRLLFDLNGDDTVEAEAWDAARRGRLDTARRVRYPLPDFLMPTPKADSAAADSVTTTPTPVTAPTDTARRPPPDTTRRPPPDTTRRPPPDTTRRPPPDTTSRVEVVS